MLNKLLIAAASVVLLLGYGATQNTDRGVMFDLTASSSGQQEMGQWYGVGIEKRTALSELLHKLKISPKATVSYNYTDGENQTVLDSRTHAEQTAANLLKAKGIPQTGATVHTGRTSGSSAGLMMALTILDSQTEGDLTNGKTIAGTGLLTKEGKVKPVARATTKYQRATEAKVNLFIVSAQQTIDEKNVPILKVETMNEAVAWLCSQGSNDQLCE